MDPTNLAAFVAIAEAGGFSAAARRLHLTQPAVSKRVALLEEQLRLRLFDRLGRQVVLTEAGEALLPRARHILAELDDARRALDNLGGEISGSLQLATSHHVGLHRLPSLLRRFAARHPQVALDIRFMDSEQAHEKVLRGEAELAVITLAPESRPPLLATPIWDDPLALVVAPDHPLAALTNPSLEQIAAHPAVLPDAATFTHQIIAARFAEHGLQPQLRMSTNYLETIRMLVSVGLAWSVLPRSMLDEQVQVLSVPDLDLRRQLGHVSRSGRTLSRAARAFISLLQEHADPFPAHGINEPTGLILEV